jgi:hypothetical protein
MMEAASTSETSVNLYQTTRRNIPEDSHLHMNPVRILAPYILNIHFSSHNGNRESK